VDGKVLVTGGLGVKDPSTTTRIYNPETDKWDIGPGLPAALHHVSAVTYKGEAVVMGGFVPGDDGTPEESDRVYVLHGGSWERRPHLIHARAAAAAAVVGDKIVVVGGEADGKLVPETEVYDGEGWRDVDEITTRREHLGAASDGHYLYAIGGRKGGPDKNLGTLERYDPESDSWKTLEPMPTAIGGVGAAYIGGRLIAVGGESPEGPSDAVQAYDIKKKTWSSELPKLLNARHGVAVTVLGDSLYAIGGAAEKGHFGSSKTAAVLDLSGAQAAAPTTPDVEWDPIRDARIRRQYAAATAEGGRVWLLGGLLDHDTASAKTARYDPAVDTWTMGPQLPRPMHHHVAVTYRDKAVVMGGFVPGDDGTPEVSDRVYVLRGGSWERLPHLIHARAAAAAAVVGDKIVVVGGEADDKLVPETEVYDGEGWRDVDEITTPREHLGAASDGHYLYAIGGREFTPDENLGALERYDPATDSWKSLEPMPTAIGGVGAAYIGGRLIAVGGESPEGPSDAVQAYDIKKKTWSSSELPKLPRPRHGVAVTVLGDSLYAIGGAAEKGHFGSSKTAAVLDFD
jgi:non-specific serine/threonine protein kinase